MYKTYLKQIYSKGMLSKNKPKSYFHNFNQQRHKKAFYSYNLL